MGEGEGSGHALTVCSKGTLLATFANPFISTNHLSIIMRAATTKMLHLFYEKSLLKTLNEMCDFFLQLMIYMMGMGEKPRNIQKYKNENKGKIPSLVALPSTKMDADCFPVSENTENKPDLP